MSHTYTQIFYHAVWATKRREHYVTDDLEDAVHGFVHARCRELGVYVHNVNGMPDHVHLVFSLPLKLALAELLEKVKGGSSQFVNHLLDTGGAQGRVLYWQEGYSALTLAKKDLSRVVEYVSNQKEHHRTGTLWRSLEWIEEPTPDGAGSARYEPEGQHRASDR